MLFFELIYLIINQPIMLSTKTRVSVEYYTVIFLFIYQNKSVIVICHKNPN